MLSEATHDCGVVIKYIRANVLTLLMMIGVSADELQEVVGVQIRHSSLIKRFFSTKSVFRQHFMSKTSNLFVCFMSV